MSAELIDLDAAQALADAATAGPWLHRESTIGGEHLIDRTDDVGYHFVLAGANEGDDAEFIAQARTLVPALIARVRAVEAEAGHVHRRCIVRGDQLVELRMAHKAARATISRVAALADLWEMEAVEQEDRDIVAMIRAAIKGGV